MLLVGGFVVGQLWSDDSTGSSSPATNVASQDRRERSGSSVSSTPSADTVDSILEVEPRPVPLETSLEPVADVADVVSPSIVVIFSDERARIGRRLGR